jgi:AraC-like DNA-binding protein
MFILIIFFLTAAFGFLSIAKLLGKNKQQEHSLINKYLLIIIAAYAARFFLHGISITYTEIYFTKFVRIVDIVSVMLMPCFYLYFYNIINEDKFKSRNLLHFFAPILLGCIFIVSYFVAPVKIDLIRKIFFAVSIFLYLVYVVFIFLLLYKNVWNRKTEINVIQKQNDVIKNWTIFLFVCIVMLLLIHVIKSLIFKTATFSDSFLWIPSLIWMSVFVKLMLTPEILYGYNFLNKTIKTEAKDVLLKNFWLIEGNAIPIIIGREKILAPKMKLLLKEYLQQIEELSFNSQAFRNPNYGLYDIGNALDIPASHVNFIFKYHCSESFSDYKKIVRINDAIKLLDKGYLNNHKVEILAIHVGFASYNTFSIAFKSITGATTHEYLKRI